MSDSSKPRLPRATEMAHRLLAERLRPGDLAIDATVGNGHDTVFLAEAVGQAGQVIGFDIQPIAIEATRHRLSEAGLSDRVELHTECHSR
ncbi:MAG: methyltransferase domain-containing protein, partial [Verrucomicrobiae bacterium]|nr:methyltransferase domain-containing protein [Verrucomicrobiae bacterium]